MMLVLMLLLGLVLGFGAAFGAVYLNTRVRRPAPFVGQASTIPLGTGTVTTPEVPQAPNGPEWARLNAATTLEDLDALDAHARQHGFGPTGRLRVAIAAKRETLV